MTEKQGGSDVRSNTTQAKPVVPGKESSGDAFWLVGALTWQNQHGE